MVIAVKAHPTNTDNIGGVTGPPGVLVTFSTVSYTHLDVYKRQVLSWGLIKALGAVLRLTGDIDPATGFYSPLVGWLDETFLPIALQLLLDVIMIAVVLLAWKVMRQKWEDIGLRSFKTRFHRDGLVGMLLGIVCCSVIFVVLLLSGNAIVALSLIHIC